MGRDLVVPVGPVADKLTLWPVDDGRYGVDAVFQGASGFTRCEEHKAALATAGVQCKVLQNLDNSWSLRLGPLTALETGQAISAFIR